MKLKINMIGGGFQHDICSSAGETPKYIEWDKTGTSNISFHIDHAIFQRTNKNKKNFAWLVESKTINQNLYELVQRNLNYIENEYEYLFTHDEELVKLSDKIKYVVCNARPWIKNKDVYKKTKLISMIASSKVMCEEHAYRQNVIKAFKSKLDHYGRGYKEIGSKEEGLNDYCFSIAMENATYPLMFTEKITDCFSTGTIPIYYGTKQISKIFNQDGIIMLDNSFDISKINYDLYYSKIDAINDNFQRTLDLPISEDFIYENYLK
jgi:hypothetical protein